MQMDLEHNAYNEHLEFNRELVVGIVSFLLLDVKQPSPSLFLNDPKTYTEQVQHAGMQAALGYLRCAIPASSCCRPPCNWRHRHTGIRMHAGVSHPRLRSLSAAGTVATQRSTRSRAPARAGGSA